MIRSRPAAVFTAADVQRLLDHRLGDRRRDPAAGGVGSGARLVDNHRDGDLRVSWRAGGTDDPGVRRGGAVPRLGGAGLGADLVPGMAGAVAVPL